MDHRLTDRVDRALIRSMNITVTKSIVFFAGQVHMVHVPSVLSKNTNMVVDLTSVSTADQRQPDHARLVLMVSTKNKYD